LEGNGDQVWRQNARRMEANARKKTRDGMELGMTKMEADGKVRDDKDGWKRQIKKLGMTKTKTVRKVRADEDGDRWKS
jgi:hypothetical protein